MPLSAPSEESSGTPQRLVEQRIAQSTAASTSTRASERLGSRVPQSTTASASTSMLPLPTIPAKNTGKRKGRQEEEEPAKNRRRKRKQGDDDEGYKRHHDLTAPNLVEQVMCNCTIPIEEILTYQPSGSRGYEPSQSTERSTSFTVANMNSYVCAIEQPRHSISY